MTIQHVIEGVGAPTAAPPSLSAHYLDTTTKITYMAVGTASAADWQPTATKSDVQAVTVALGGKVDAVPGKVLSTEDFSTEDKAKLAALEPGGGGGGGAIGDVLVTAGSAPLGYALMGSSYPLGTYPALDAIFAGGTFSASQFAFPFNMNVNGIAINGDTVVAVTAIQSGTGKNIFRSTDRGVTWSLNDAEVWYAAHAVACDPYGRWVVACASGYYAISEDDGVTWQTIKITGLSQDLRGVCHVADGNWVIVGAAGNVVVGQDYGTSWYLADPAIPVANVGGVVVGPGGKLFAATSAGIYTSEDSGWVWTPTSITTGQYDCIDVDGDVIVAGGSSVLARSGDGGLTWTVETWLSGEDVSFRGIAANKSGAFLGVGFTNTAFQSFDRGVSWERVTIGNSQNAVVCLQNGTRDWVVVGNSGANYKVTTAPASLRIPGFPVADGLLAYMKAE